MVVEGTVEEPVPGRVGVRLKGAQTKGVVLYNDAADAGNHVLAVQPGWGGAAQVAERFWQQSEAAPRLGPATFEDIPEVDCSDETAEPPSAVAAAYVIDHPGFDGSEDGRGVVFLATDRQGGPPGEGIVNGYMVCPAGSAMTSEHGSMYEADPARWGGRAADYRPGSLSFRDAMKLGRAAEDDDDIERTWDAISGRR